MIVFFVFSHTMILNLTCANFDKAMIPVSASAWNCLWSCTVIVNYTSIHITRLLTFSTTFLCFRLVGGVCWDGGIYWNANLSSYLLFRGSCRAPTPFLSHTISALTAVRKLAAHCNMLFLLHEGILTKLPNNWHPQLYPLYSQRVLTFRLVEQGKPCFCCFSSIQKV